MSFEMFFDPDVVPPVDGDYEQVTITWPLPPGMVTAGTWVMQAAIKAFTPTVPESGKMGASVSLSINGGIAITPSAAV